jgi:hypothetical protein
MSDVDANLPAESEADAESGPLLPESPSCDPMLALGVRLVQRVDSEVGVTVVACGGTWSGLLFGNRIPRP